MPTADPPSASTVFTPTTVLSMSDHTPAVGATAPGGTALLQTRVEPTDSTYLAAAISGSLVIDQETSCVALAGPDGGVYQLLWPPGYSVRTSGSSIEVLKADGTQVGAVGDEVTLGGAELSYETVPPYPLDPCITTYRTWSVAPF